MKAIVAAKNNVSPGLIFYSEDIGSLEASIVLAPDISLKRALGMVLVVQMGIADSLGALAPPELAVHFNWPNSIKVNGAFCGKTFFSASTKEEDIIPEWLVLGFKIPFLWVLFEKFSLFLRYFHFYVSYVYDSVIAVSYTHLTLPTKA